MDGDKTADSAIFSAAGHMTMSNLLWFLPCIHACSVSKNPNFLTVQDRAEFPVHFPSLVLKSLGQVKESLQEILPYTALVLYRSSSGNLYILQDRCRIHGLHCSRNLSCVNLKLSHDTDIKPNHITPAAHAHAG